MAAQARAKAEAKRAAALEGITNVSFSLSAQVKIRGRGEMWVKFGGEVTPSEGEDAIDAKERLVAFVAESLQEQIDVLSGGD